MGVGAEHNAFLFHEADTTFDDGLLQFEIGNAIAKQSTDPVAAFEHGHPVAGLIQLCCCGQTCGA